VWKGKSPGEDNGAILLPKPGGGRERGGRGGKLRLFKNLGKKKERNDWAGRRQISWLKGTPRCQRGTKKKKKAGTLKRKVSKGGVIQQKEST